MTGGFVYRGSALPARFQGRYFFGDSGSGRVWSLGLMVDAETRKAVVADEVEHTDELGGTRRGLASFGRDLGGEIYLVTQAGEIYRLVSGEPPPAEGEGPRTTSHP